MRVKFNVSKALGIPYPKYKGSALKLTIQTPAKVDEVIISPLSDSTKQKKITTFRDSNGNIIERAFDYYNEPYRNRLYTRTDNIIGTNEFVTSTTKKDYTLNREALGYYKDLIAYPRTKRTILWTKQKTETNHVSENIDTGEKIQTQVIIKPLKKKQEQHSFIEYPHITDKKIQNKPQKVLKFKIKTKHKEVIKSSIERNGVQNPNKDSFLGYRAFSIEDSKVPFSEKYLHERGLDDMNITINPEFNPLHIKDTKFSGMFNADEGVLRFNKGYKFKTKSYVANISAHESEHGWQYYLQARLIGGDTPWQTEISEKFGELTNPKQIKEAQEYDDAIKNYVPYWQNLEEYRKNKIEKLAKQKGFAEQAKYDKEGEIIRKDFPHIPPELL